MTESLRCAAEGSTECKSAVFPLKKLPKQVLRGGFRAL